ncbi:hypothetical protein [Citricoccus sp. GCM10030269]|uniref:hypothetical protein n=1 Tax=Citricoccus sp. GCM10030269 TaxID=3273388 RepID=UPI00361D97AD
MDSADETIDRDRLEDYLNHHLLGAQSGVRMFQTASDTWRGTEYEQQFTDLAEQVYQDQQTVEKLIDRLGMKVPITGKAIGKAAQVAGRLNPVNLTRSKTRGMTQVEMDILQGALQAKSGMWHVLGLLAVQFPDAGLDRQEMEVLYQRAQDQEAQVRRISEETLGTRFIDR